MDNNIINDDIIEKVVIKSVAIYKAMSVLSAPPFEDKFLNKQDICQQNENIQKQSLEKCLRETEPSKENEIIDTTNDIKKNLEKKSWKDITDPKERKKAYHKAYHKVYREANKDILKIKKKDYIKVNKDKIKAHRKEYYQVNKDRINLKKKAYNKAYGEANKDKIKAYREANKDILKIKKKAYYKANEDIFKVKKKNYYEANKEKLKLIQKAYNDANKGKRNKHLKHKLKTDSQFKLSCYLRGRLRSAIKGNFKAGSAVKDLGCSIEELKQHLESKFSPGMTWDNWTTDGWHIDHIKPLASFDLTDRKQLLEACHYTNLQPLWAKDNLTKNDKII